MVGSISELWRFPVKSMGGEKLDNAELSVKGIIGDRGYALIETDTGKVVSAKSVKLFPGLMNCKAAFVETPVISQELPPVRISLPDGTTVMSDSRDADNALSLYFKRNVRLARTAPDDVTIDQYKPDVEGADPSGNKDKVVPQKLGAALFAELGMESPVPAGAFFDIFPLSVVTTSSLTRLNELEPTSRFDPRRFRMNVIIDTQPSGFIENDWLDHELSFGDKVRIKVVLPDPRCVMTTLAQDDLPDDTGILKTLVRHNRIQVGDLGMFPCVGVYAEIAAPGVIHTGHQVTLSSAN
jgi:uncharacterized protein YcbX